ncbi:hypothetical protein AVEN_250432-1 [Araneus ventricosus]|uniref:Uncharacterized protein n=1 Tax=Araneus ventricosus TaxID=182803 RepID=A0A4Y2EE49_ARAVE|nr:hypothetical protein AVEN_250432-1 [Araneus ventricosus]
MTNNLAVCGDDIFLALKYFRCPWTKVLDCKVLGVGLDKPGLSSVESLRWCCGGRVVSFRLRRVPGSKPDSTEDPSCIGPVAR